ncbi:MAG: hypothetical protein AAF730_07815 [Bacteroidota bacterium]
MSIIWGLLTIVIGIFMPVSGFRGKETGVYRFLAARSRILWDDRVHQFYLVSGLVVAMVGVAMTVNSII